MIMPPPLVLLEMRQDRYCALLGYGRREDAILNGYVHRNNRRVTPEEALEVDIMSARSEGAGFIYLGGDKCGVWFDWPYRPGNPDYDIAGVIVDAKAVPWDSYSLMVPEDDVRPEWAYMLISWERHPVYAMLGWAWGRELLTKEVREPQRDRPAHVIEQGDPLLKDCEELREYCWSRL